MEQGIGLLDVSIDVHAAQWGTVSRLIAAAEAGLIDGGLAIDEDTVLVVGEGGLVVSGRRQRLACDPGRDRRAREHARRVSRAERTELSILDPSALAAA